jgi:hypothetical protein
LEEPNSLDSIFKERILRIPDYQRGYAWQRDQLKDFWEDLVNLSGHRSHYTGVLTLREVPRENIASTSKEYWLAEDHSYRVYEIVDGQQRLTTFVIMLQAFVDFYKNLPENLGKPESEIYISDSLNLAEMQKRFLFKVKPTGDQFRTYKFGYTEDNPSDKYLRYKILGEPDGGEIAETFYTLNLSNAKTYFGEQIRALYLEDGNDGLQEVYKKLTKRFLFNVYVIKDSFDVFVAFETMNNRGKKLSDLELLKNRLIYLTTLYSDDELEEDGRHNLRSEINDAWKEVYYQLGRNKERPLNDDDFLRAHWTMYFMFSRQTAKDYIRFLLDDKFSPKKVHKKIETTVQLDAPEIQRSEDDGEVGEEDFVEDSVSTMTISAAQLSPVEIRHFVGSLRESAVHWFTSFFPEKVVGLTSDEVLWIDRLNRIGIAYFRPLCMAILKNEKDPAKRVAIFRQIERYIFIVFRMSNYQANYKSSEFYNLARQLDQGHKSLNDIFQKLEENMAFSFTDQNVLVPTDFYNVLQKKFKQAEGYYSWAGIRYFLFEYELSLLSESRLKKVSWTELLKSEKDKISIEHIYPQTEDHGWAETFSGLSEQERKIYRSNLGNLLLLSMSVNASLQNDSFNDKKSAKIDSQGSKIRNGYNDGSHSETEVSLQSEWGPQQIEERSLKLLEFMEKRWGFRFRSDEEKRRFLFLDFEAEPKGS